jgi:hypothetical protein
MKSKMSTCATLHERARALEVRDESPLALISDLLESWQILIHLGISDDCNGDIGVFRTVRARIHFGTAHHVDAGTAAEPGSVIMQGFGDDVSPSPHTPHPRSQTSPAWSPSATSPTEPA